MIESRFVVQRAWERAWRDDLGIVAPDVTPILDRYDEPHRRYHTIHHIFYMLQAQSTLTGHPSPQLVIATVFHDCVYKVGSPTNEDQSARIARNMLYGTALPVFAIDEIVALIECTEFRYYSRQPGTLDEALIRDSDLAGFVNREVCQANDKKIHDEFIAGGVSEADYAAGRPAFLQAMLDLRQIYHSPSAVGREWESAARRNIVRGLNELT